MHENVSGNGKPNLLLNIDTWCGARVLGMPIEILLFQFCSLPSSKFNAGKATRIGKGYRAMEHSPGVGSGGGCDNHFGFGCRCHLQRGGYQ